MAKFIKYPFALAGDKTPIPNNIQIDGSVSYTEGWGVDYAKNASTQVLCDLTGTPGTLIPAGSSVVRSDSGYSFQLLDPVTLNGVGVANGVLFQSMTTGFVAAPAGTVQTIVFGVPGWTAVTNPAPAFIDLTAKKVPRPQSNQVLFDISDNTNQYQTHGFPDFITALENDGVLYPYDAWAIVRYDSGGGYNLYQSLVDANNTLPTNTATWTQLTGISNAADGVYVKNASFDVGVLNRDVVAWNTGTGLFVPALGDGTFTGLLIGMADIPNSRVLLIGEIDGPFIENDGITPQNLLPNTTYYMSNVNRPGHITRTPSDPNILVSVGVSKGPNLLFFCPQIINSARAQLFTVNGSFTVPFNVQQVLISACAGGGGGGGGGNANSNGSTGSVVTTGGGGGGAAGNFVVKQRIVARSGDVIDVLIGAGGSAGAGGVASGAAGQTGGTGGQTIIQLNAVPIITLSGGLGGAGSAGLAGFAGSTPGGLGGAPSGGAGGTGFAISGPGGIATGISGNGGFGGAGYFATTASGGRGTQTSGSISAGTSSSITKGYGGGGGGGSGRKGVEDSGDGPGASGGSGGSGFVLIEY